MCVTYFSRLGTYLISLIILFIPSTLSRCGIEKEKDKNAWENGSHKSTPCWNFNICKRHTSYFSLVFCASVGKVFNRGEKRIEEKKSHHCHEKSKLYARPSIVFFVVQKIFLKFTKHQGLAAFYQNIKASTTLAVIPLRASKFLTLMCSLMLSTNTSEFSL